MSEDRREGQSKFDRPAAGTGMPRPAVPAAPAATSPAGHAAPAQPAPPAAPVAPARAAPPLVEETDDVSDYEEDDMPLALVDRLRRLSPAAVILTIGSIGSFVVLFFSVTSHTTPVAVLMSAAVVTGLVFGLDAVIAAVVTWRASQNGEAGLAFIAAVVGGVASLVSLGAFAGTLVMILVLER